MNRREAKTEATLTNQGLNVDQLTITQLRQANAANIAATNTQLLGSGLYSFGSLLQGKGDTAFIINALKAQVEQNWVIIRQNEQIIQLLNQQVTRPQQ